MTDSASTHRTSYDATIASKSIRGTLEQAVDEIRNGWELGQAGELASALLEKPELLRDRSVVIDLAAEEFRLRHSEDSYSTILEYCRPFLQFGSTLHSSIVRQIQVELYLDGHPSLCSLDDQNIWPEIGKRIGDFQVLEQLGDGSLARVYLCSQIGLGNRQVVVKVSRRSTHEANTLGRLQHPHIMPVHSVAAPVDAGLSCLCTPFLGRSTLRDLILHAFANGLPNRANVIEEAAKIKVLDSDQYVEGPQQSHRKKYRAYVEDILSLVIQLTKALAHAHSKGIIHGDLKPSNVLLTPTGEPVLLDFNLSQDDTLGDGVLGGTIPYMAPEQLSALKIDKPGGGQRFKLDERSEVFSLGVILYELLSGQLPFEVENTSTTADYPQRLHIKQRQGPASLRDHNPQVGQSVTKLTKRCLAYDPADRFASMADLRSALLGELGLWRRTARWAKTHRRTTISLFACALAIMVATSLWWINRPPYAVRQYENGLEYYAAQEFDKALVAFEQATKAQPDYLDANYAIARTNLAIGKNDTALKQFTDLAKQHKHAPSMACAGYCYNRMKPHDLAIWWYEKALDNGHHTAGVHNNLAVSYELGKSAYSKLESIKLGREHLEKALIISPSLTVYLNIAYNELQHCAVDPSYIPRSGIKHLKILLEQGALDARVYVLLPRLSGVVAQVDTTVIGKTIELLIKGCEQNVRIDLDPLVSNPLFQPFLEHERFPALQKAAAKQDPAQRITRQIPRFIDPGLQLVE